MKLNLLISLLFFSLAAHGRGITAIDTVILGKRLIIIVASSHRVNFKWGTSKKTLSIKDSIFSQDIRDYKINRILEYTNAKSFKKSKSIYLSDDRNLFIVLPITEGNICLLGLEIENDSINLWKNDFISSYHQHNDNLIYISAPSIVILKHRNILYGSKALNLDINDSIPKLCSFITLLHAASDGHFYLNMKYPALIDPNDGVEIWEEEIRYYKKIIGLKFIENPLDLETKTN